MLVAVALVALPACDDGDAGLNASSADETAASTSSSFSTDRLAGVDLAIDGVVETSGDRTGRIEVHTESRLSDTGAKRASAPALHGLPSEIRFEGNTLTYTTADGETRTVELSERDAAMLGEALDARQAAQRETPDGFEPVAPKSGSASGEDVLASMKQNGYTVEPLGNDRYAVTAPPRHEGAVQVTSVYNASTGQIEGSTARHDAEDVIEIGVTQAKDGKATPQVNILDED